MTALRFQTSGRYPTSPASLRVVAVVAVVAVVVVADVVVNLHIALAAKSKFAILQRLNFTQRGILWLLFELLC